MYFVLDVNIKCTAIKLMIFLCPIIVSLIQNRFPACECKALPAGFYLFQEDLTVPIPVFYIHLSYNYHKQHTATSKNSTNENHFCHHHFPARSDSLYGIFHFDDDGHVERFTTQRYMGGGADAKQQEWVVEVKERQRINGIIIPTQCDAIWRLEDGDWAWAKLSVVTLDHPPDL